MVWSAGELTSADMNTYLPQAWQAWTPTITAQSGTFTTVSGAGRYIAYGDTIHWSCTITITTVGTAAGGVRFTLPATAQSSPLHIGNGRENTATGEHLTIYAVTTTVGLVLTYSNGDPIGAGRTLILAGTYEKA